MVNSEGCEYGHLLKQAFETFCKRLDSKLEGIETLLVAWRDIKFPKLDAKLADASEMLIKATAENVISRRDSARAVEVAENNKKDFDSLWLRVFFAVIGSTLVSSTILLVGAVAVYKLIIEK